MACAAGECLALTGGGGIAPKLSGDTRAPSAILRQGQRQSPPAPIGLVAQSKRLVRAVVGIHRIRAGTPAQKNKTARHPIARKTKTHNKQN